MAKFIKKKYTCRCCGRQIENRILSGIYISQSIGLDKNPHEPYIYDTVYMCPSCGYSTTGIYKSCSEKIKKIVKSSDYQAMVNRKMESRQKKYF